MLKGPLMGLGDWTNLGGTVGKSSAVRGLLGKASGSKYVRGGLLGLAGMAYGEHTWRRRQRNARYPIR